VGGWLWGGFVCVVREDEPRDLGSELTNTKTKEATNSSCVLREIAVRRPTRVPLPPLLHRMGGVEDHGRAGRSRQARQRAYPRPRV